MSCQKKHKNNEMNTTVFLLLLCILTVLCGHGGCESDFNKDFHRGFSGQQRGGYNYGQIIAGANSQAFAKSGTYSNAASGCDYGTQNGFVGNGPSNKDAWITSQAYSNVVHGFGDMTQNTEKLALNDFSKSQSKSFPSTSVQSSESSGSQANQGQNTGLLFSNYFSKSQSKSFPLTSGQSYKGSGYHANQGSNTGLFSSNGFSKSQSKSFSLTSGQSSEGTGSHANQGQNTGLFSSNDFSKSQSKSFPLTSGQSSDRFKSQANQGQNTGLLFSNYFSKSQSKSLPLTSGQSSEVYNSGSYADPGQHNVQNAKSFDNRVITFPGSDHTVGQKVESYGNEFRGSLDKENQDKSRGIKSDQSLTAVHGFHQNSGNDYGSQLSKESSLGTGSSNGNTQSYYNRQEITGNGQKYTYDREGGDSKYQVGIQSKGLRAGRVFGQSSESDGGLINNANSNDQESLSSSSGASNHEDLQSTLSGALGLVSQGLQASQNQPCKSCEKSSYASSDAKSYSGSAIAFSIAG